MTNDLLITGHEYTRAMTARRSDRRTRTAFQQLALETAGPHGTVFDFGSGPGIDARFYAEHGHTVSAYDIDPRMCDFFAEHCQVQIRSGCIHLHRGSFPDFLTGRVASPAAPFDLVTANFAPLNLIGELEPTFARFARLTGPNGAVLASVLNPWFVGDLRYGWWWHHVPQLMRRGHYRLPGAQGWIVRRTVADFSRQCTPHFHLHRVLCTPLSRFMFLLFRKPCVP